LARGGSEPGDDDPDLDDSSETSTTTSVGSSGIAGGGSGLRVARVFRVSNPEAGGVLGGGIGGGRDLPLASPVGGGCPNDKFGSGLSVVVGLADSSEWRLDAVSPEGSATREPLARRFDDIVGTTR
jgi:hypothetical protein